MNRVCISGAELAFEQGGAGEPVVLLHGALVADALRPLLRLPGLTARYRLTNYHRRGYGNSSRVLGPVDIARQAADCRELLRRLGIRRAHVLGHSFGGAVALQLALDAPDQVHSLALIEPALMVGTSGTGYRDSLAGGIERYRMGDTEALVDGFLEARTPDCRSLLDRLLPGAFAQAVRDAATTFEIDLPGLLNWNFGETEARRIHQPILSVLGGTSDSIAPRFGETHHWLLRWAPRAEGVTLPGTTHFPQLEDPEGTARALSAFWLRHPVPPGEVEYSGEGDRNPESGVL